MAILTISNYYANAMLNQAFRNTAFTRPTTVYLALYTTDPTRADTGTEVTGGGYARRPITFGAPADETVQIYNPNTGATMILTFRGIKNSAEIVYPIATSPQGTITHMGIRDAATGGNLFYFGPLDNPRSVSINDVVRFPVGYLLAGMA